MNILEIAKNVRDGDVDGLQRLFDYFLPRIGLHKYYDPNRLIDRDDILSVAKVAIWKSCKEFNLGQHFCGKVILRARNEILNEIELSTRRSAHTFEERFWLALSNTSQCNSDDSIEHYRYLVTQIHIKLSRKNELASKVFQLLVDFPCFKKKHIAKVIHRSPSLVSHLIKDFIKPTVQDFCIID